LNSFDSLERCFEKDKANLIAVKCLVESQNVRDLLEHFVGSKALWMYRHYKDVAASNLKHFGLQNGIEDLRAIAAGSATNWRSEKLSPAVREDIRKHFT
ncbi:hypothetical protein, partial [Falsihalocynthiibacter sp. CO-5D18]|uniref:hypothetical protein n=1 Tax=Falsihalocynthiibacter sp. CO-5D18 TaxID=3240872 RepID=UPI00350FA330